MNSLSGCTEKHYHMTDKEMVEQINWINQIVIRAIDTHQKIHFQSAGKCQNDFKMVILNVCTNLIKGIIDASANGSQECAATLVAQHIAKLCVDLGISQDTKIEMIEEKSKEELH